MPKPDFQQKHAWGALPWLGLSLFIFILDQATKCLAIHYLTPLQPVSLLPFLDLALAYNTGAAFSFLSQAGGWQAILFDVIAIVIILFMLVWMWRISAKKYLLSVGLALIIGGAFGNLVDRIRMGYVTDFIDFHVHQWHWPIFNVADSAITIGVFLLIIDMIKRPKR